MSELDKMEQAYDDDASITSGLNGNSPGNEASPTLLALREFVGQYNAYVDRTLAPLENRLRDLLAVWRQPGYWDKLPNQAGEPLPTPVQRVRVRIKPTGAVVRKVLAKPDRFPDGFCNRSFESMTDTVGARVVAYFLSSLPLIDREIRNCGWFDISTDHPPHAYMSNPTREALGIDMECHTKPSGYNSIHYVLRLREEIHPDDARPWFELQLRTLTQDVWAEIEHLLGYKYRTSSPMVQAQSQLVGRLLGTIDEHFDYMAKELSDSRNQGRFDETAPLTVVNLPLVLASHGLSCSQYDIAGVLKMALGFGIQTVHDLSGVLTSENIDRVSNAARVALGRTPAGSELIPALLLFGRMTDAERDSTLAQWAEFVQMFKAAT
ncbi:MAG: hypothetical protein PHR28_13215 [candidate division Zixibacteria bacterium]|nr:hypothetical protein [candidate division Zixibacteria bacterium]